MQMSSPALQTACYLVEWYRPELIDDRFCMALAHLNTCVTAMTSPGTPVRILHTLTVPTDQAVFGVIAADSQEIVTELCRRAGIPADRITAAISTGLRPCDI
jgi:hypothetical protein